MTEGHDEMLLVGQDLSVSLTVNDLEKSLWWYHEVLGFSIRQKFEREGTLFAVSLTSGDASILITQDNGSRGGNRVKGEGFSFRITTTQDIDALAEAIKVRGGVLESGPDVVWGQRFFRLLDPDGFRLTISSVANS